MEEKKKKKQKQIEEREREKKQRQEMKRKAEEKARKEAPEKAKKAKEWKIQAKLKKNTGSTSASAIDTGRKQINVSSATSTSSSCEGPPPKKVRLDKPTSNSIDPNVCCMCFGTYEDDILEGVGAEWISCACGRWLHKDCGEDCIADENGQERFCLFCLDFLSS